MARKSSSSKTREQIGYFERSQRPLACLALLLPLVVLYEIGTLAAQPAAAVQQSGGVVAQHLLEWFFAVFGATSLHLPGLAVVAILTAWHVANRDPWTIHLPTTVGMAGESLLLAVPLLVLSRLLQPVAVSIQPRNLLDEVVLSVGAGIYEELLFRLILISLFGMILVDIAGFKRTTGYGFGIVASSALFAAHHYQPLGSEGFAMASFAFRSAAGLYLAGVFVLRGFGIAVGCHTAYNLMLVLLHL